MVNGLPNLNPAATPAKPLSRPSSNRPAVLADTGIIAADATSEQRRNATAPSDQRRHVHQGRFLGREKAESRPTSAHPTRTIVVVVVAVIIIVIFSCRLPSAISRYVSRFPFRRNHTVPPLSSAVRCGLRTSPEFLEANVFRTSTHRRDMP